MVVQPIYNYVDFFHEDLAVVAKNCNDCYDNFDGVCGYIDRKGNEVIPCIYRIAFSFYHGKAWVKTFDDKWLEIDKKGKILRTTDEEQYDYYSRLEQENKYKYDKIYNRLTYVPDSSHIVVTQVYGGYRLTDSQTNYWDNPETVWFFPVEIYKSENKTLMARSYRNNTYFNDFKTDQLKPVIALVSNENNQIEVEKIFSLSDDISGENMEVLNQVVDFEGLMPYLVEGADGLELKDKDKYRIVLATSIIIPTEKIKENVFFNIISKGILLKTVDSERTINNFYMSPYDYMTERICNIILDSMQEDAKMIGELYQDDERLSQSITDPDNPYHGRTIAEVMMNITHEDILSFLDYMAARPFIYMGEKWSFSEVFATWIDAGAPMVIH